MTLLREQAQFADWVCQSEVDDAQITNTLTASAVSAERGLAVYQNNLRLASRGAMAGTFPVMAQLLGEGGFALAVRDYRVAYPSRSGDLNELGRHFSEFIAGYGPLRGYPYLSDVAGLEWCWHQSYFAENHTPLQVEDLIAHGTEALLSAQVQFAKSAFLYRGAHAAASIWLAHQSSGDLAVLRDDAAIFKAEFAMVSRPLWRVQVRVLDEAVFAFLSLLQSGATFEAALSEVDEMGLPFDFAAWLPVLVESGIWSEVVWIAK